MSPPEPSGYSPGRAGRLASILARFDVLALTAVIWFLAKFLRYAFPPLFGTLQGAYGVSNTVVGTTFSALLLVYAAVQFPSGTLADRFGAVRVIAAGALVAAAGALSLVVPAPYAALVAGTILVGLGTGAHKTVAVGLMSRVYPARTGRALGVMDTVGALGGVAAPAAVVVLLPDRWRLLFLGAGVAGGALAGTFLLRVPDGDPARENGGTTRPPLSTYLALFRDRRVTLFVAVTVLFSFAYNGAVAFLPLFLTDAGLSSSAAGLVYAALFAVSFVQVATGDLSDRAGQLPVMAATMTLAAAGLAGALVGAALGAGAVAFGAAVVAFGLGSHGFRPVRGAYLVRIVPDDVAGGTLGIVRTILMGAGAFSPGVTGYLADTAGFGAAFALLAGALVGAALLVGALALSE